MTQAILPYPPGYGQFGYGPVFDGRQAHNTTTDPYTNALLEGVNTVQNQLEFPTFAAMPGFPFIQPNGGPNAGHGKQNNHGKNNHDKSTMANLRSFVGF